jgi:hypothetical protein
MTLGAAVKKIDERGALLVFPLDNRKEPASLWSEFYPKSKMRWEWDSGGDNRVANLWHLREELSRSKKVVYAKWFRGRATFFSRELFSALLRRMGGVESLARSLPDEAQQILGCLLSESPLSTKQLKKRMKLEGHYNEKAYESAMKALWMRLLIVGYGEVDDGAFPSLAVGASEVMFEELIQRAHGLSLDKATAVIRHTIGGTLFEKELLKIEKKTLTLSKLVGHTISGAQLSIASKART